MNPRSRDQYEACVLLHLPLVRSIARKLHQRLPQNVELSDLISAGTLGLLDAIRKYNPRQEASLATYAAIRIRGAILDSLRTDDWGPRRLRQMARRMDSARHVLAITLGRNPSDPELAAAMEMSLEEYQDQLAQVCSLRIAAFTDPREEDAPGASIDDLPSADPGALQSLLATEGYRRLVHAVRALPPRERRVVVAYYKGELSMREIGVRMEVSESRICQIHAAALARLKRKLDVAV